MPRLTVDINEQPDGSIKTLVGTDGDKPLQFTAAELRIANAIRHAVGLVAGRKVNAVEIVVEKRKDTNAS